MNTIGSKISDSSSNVSSSRGTSAGLSAGGAQAITTAGAVRQAAPINGNMILAQMQPGSTFSGDIIDVRGSAIKLLLSGEKTLNAAATDAKNLNIGDHITFNVTSNNGSTVVIKPVKVNSYNTNVLLKSLEAAELPVTERNIEIIKAMMKHEMSIDKKSVTDMMKKIEGFKIENPENIVSMDKHGIPLTQENVDQFAAYKNYEHRIMAQAESMASELPDMLNDMVSRGDETKAVSVAKELITILNDKLLNPDIVSNDIDKQGTTANINMSEAAVSSQNATENMSAADVDFLKNMGLMEQEDMVYTPEYSRYESKVNLSFQQVMNNLNTLTGNELKAFIQSDDFKEFIRDRVERSFELDAEKMSEEGDESKKTVKKLYENLDNKTENILAVLEKAGESTSKLAQTAGNIRNNMQFMQDLNQMASYIQLPIKFNESKAHGDLYVFNRKKGMPVDKDVVTAFLHLDMDNLGATDVHVTMEKNFVSIKFALDDVESIAIVDEHLPELADKLEKKGYTTSFTVEQTEEGTAKTPFDKVLETDKPQISIKRYSFDVRA